MAKETFTKESFWAELESLGVDAVRTRVVTGAYSTVTEKHQFAEEWLSRKDKEGSDEIAQRNTGPQSVEIALAQSAKDAAWITARAANRANIYSVIALIGAAIAIAVSIIGLFLKS